VFNFSQPSTATCIAERKQESSAVRRQPATLRETCNEGARKTEQALELDGVKDELGQLKKQMEKFRQTLLNGINGGVTDAQRYRNISLYNLLRTRLQEQAQGDGDLS
jgi:hypothetical protein